jgi:hypothetical protein
MGKEDHLSFCHHFFGVSLSRPSCFSLRHISSSWTENALCLIAEQTFSLLQSALSWISFAKKKNLYFAVDDITLVGPSRLIAFLYYAFIALLRNGICRISAAAAKREAGGVGRRP